VSGMKCVQVFCLEAGSDLDKDAPGWEWRLDNGRLYRKAGNENGYKRKWGINQRGRHGNLVLSQECAGNQRCQAPGSVVVASQASPLH
jgi:hypothetical protein